MRTHPNRVAARHAGGFTLVELLIVILIIVLLTAATLPAVLPALNSRRVSEGSRILQSELARARDTAVRTNAPAGFRLIADPFDPSRPDVLTSSRLVALDLPTSYDEGTIRHDFQTFPPTAYPPVVGADWEYYAPAPGLPPLIDGSGNPLYSTYTSPFPVPPAVLPEFLQYPYLVVRQDKASPAPNVTPSVLIPNSPTSWFFNIRQGEKLNFNDSGNTYTVAGPVANPTVTVTAFSDISTAGSPLANPARLINYGQGYFATFTQGSSGNPSPPFEFLFLVNGEDDDGDGYIDDGFDGVDNDGDGIIDPGFNGRDDNGNGLIDEPSELYLHNSGTAAMPNFIYPGNPFGLSDGGFPAFLSPGIRNRTPLPNEYEEERIVHPRVLAAGSGLAYNITRRPQPTPGAKEVAMPTNVVIDLTTWNAGQNGIDGAPERSRLPVDPYTGFVDVIVAPNGQILGTGTGTTASPPVAYPFYHFWVTERDEVAEPGIPGSANFAPGVALPTARPYWLPMTPSKVSAINPPPWADPRMPSSSYASIDPTQNVSALRGERRLLSVNTRSGVITATTIETMYLNNTSYPFEAAEAGVEDAQP